MDLLFVVRCLMRYDDTARRIVRRVRGGLTFRCGISSKG